MMPGTTGLTADGAICVVPANEARWEDLQAVFGTRGVAAGCQCQRSRSGTPSGGRSPSRNAPRGCASRPAAATPTPARRAASSPTSTASPLGWCAVEPRTAYLRLLRTRVPWTGRDEDTADDRHLGRDLLRHSRGLPAQRSQPRAGARRRRLRPASAAPVPLEGYPMITQPGQEVTWGELHVGSRSIFAAAGFTEVSRPTLRRVVMRIDF